MTEAEARDVYDIAWQAYSKVGSLPEQLGKAGDDEGAVLGRRFAQTRTS